MTRRAFFNRLMQVGAAAFMGGVGLARLLAVRRVVRAEGLGWYPGKVTPLADVKTQAKWGG